MANQEVLALGPEASVARTVSECLSKQALNCVLNASDAKGAIAEITADELLLAECRRSVGAVTRMGARCGPEFVYVALQPLIIMFGTPDFGSATESLVKTWISLYQDALKHLPREALEHAVSQHIAFGKPFFPKPSELNALAKKRAEEVWLISWRVRSAVEFADKHAPVMETAEERARGKALVAETIAAIRRGGLRAIPRNRAPSVSQHVVAERLRQMAT